MRHVSRTHRVALDWLFDRINLDPKIQIKYIDTQNQLADILTKGSFTHDEWNHLLCLFNISHFSSTACSETMAKRSQHDSGEERVTAKSRPMMSLIARTPSVVSSSFGKTIMGKALWENPIEARLGESFQLGMPIRTPSRRVILICVCGWHKLAGKKQNLDPMWKSTQQWSWFGRNNIFPRSCLLGVLKDKVKQAKILLTKTEPCLNPEFPQEQLKNYHAPKICVSLRGPTKWKVMPRSVWSDIVS